jgi:hypothetical protein
MEGSMTRGCERGLSALVAGTMRAAVAILLESILKDCERDCRGPEERRRERMRRGGSRVVVAEVEIFRRQWRSGGKNETTHE